jgi:20S proteasome alpha/beta subunit
MAQAADLSRAAWRTSSYSNNGGNCVGVADSEGVISVRDTKANAGPVLAFSPETWERFTACLKG